MAQPKAGIQKRLLHPGSGKLSEFRDGTKVYINTHLISNSFSGKHTRNKKYE